MKNMFFSHYTPSKEEFKSLWDSCLFSFDANTLLDIYSYSSSTADEIIDAIEGYKDRLWLPYQAGFEYYKNREIRISQEVDAYDLITKGISDVISELEKPKHPFIISKDETIKHLKETIGELNTAKEEHSKLLTVDKYRDKIPELFEGKVGDEFPKDIKEQIFKEGEKRYTDEIPPGYKDKGKPSNKYGDLILWKEVIEKAKKDDIDVILVTSETKEDWWKIHKGKTLGPRPELLEEFHKGTDGKKIYIYHLLQFLEQAKTHLSDKAKGELTSRREEYFAVLEKEQQNIFKEQQKYEELFGNSVAIDKVLMEQQKYEKILNSSALTNYSQQYEKLFGDSSVVGKFIKEQQRLEKLLGPFKY